MKRVHGIVGVLIALMLAQGISSADSLVILASDAAVKTVGNPTPQSATEPEAGWNLFSDGELGDFVRIPSSGRYEIVARARGTPARGGWPLMAVVIDGQPTTPVTVATNQFIDFVFPLVLSAGVHRVTAAFLNDEYNPPLEDRNLYISRLELRSAGADGDPTLARFDDWVPAARERETETLAGTEAAIQRHRQGPATLRVLDSRGTPVAGAQVSVELVRHEFLFGGNFFQFDRFPTAAENEVYRTRFAELFNYATLGFYWRWYEPKRGEPNYAYTDQVVAWCREHGIRLKGHPLLWNQEAGVPAWLEKQPEPTLQRQRVTEIIQRYHGRIEFWEVVNEPSHLPGLDIDAPHRWARAADPTAQLIVNDFGVISSGAPQFFALLKRSVAEQIPFDGIGIQAHEPRNQRFSMDVVRQRLDEYATLGKPLHITEFTPTSGGESITGSFVTGRWDEAGQSDYAVKFYRTCFAHPAVAAITWWDFSDHGAWLAGGGLLRADLTPKPAFEALRRLIHREWHTKLTGETNGTGRFSFRGFYGRYRVAVACGGKQGSQEFDLRREPPAGAPAEWALVLRDEVGNHPR